LPLTELEHDCNGWPLRFGKDADIVDTQLIEYTNVVVDYLSSILGCLVVVCIVFPSSLLVILCVSFLVYIALSYYRRTSVELKRLDALAGSPLHAHIAETLSGLTTIRAFCRTRDFIDHNQVLTDKSLRAINLTLYTERWMFTRVVLASGVLTSATFLFGAMFRESISPALFGLAVVFSVQLTTDVSLFVRDGNVVSWTRVSSLSESFV
jgi:ATP-binding cassette, subfamily C (CFTR/MRP), member 1